jgi:hypothetical protein
MPDVDQALTIQCSLGLHGLSDPTSLDELGLTAEAKLFIHIET